jgi:hypothetical protein
MGPIFYFSILKFGILSVSVVCSCKNNWKALIINRLLREALLNISNLRMVY